MQAGNSDEIVLCRCGFLPASTTLSLVLSLFLMSPNSIIHYCYGNFFFFKKISLLVYPFFSNDLLSLFNCKFTCLGHFVEKMF